MIFSVFMGKQSRIIFLIIAIIVVIIFVFIPIYPENSGINYNFASVVKDRIDGKQNVPLSTTKLLFGGDVMLGRTVMTKSQDESDYNYPFRYISSTLRNADIAFVNLENPFVAGCKRDYDSMVFCAVPEMADGLEHAGIDIVSLANNHSLNYGEIGLDQTIEILSQKNIKSTNEKLEIIEKNNIKFGFIGFDFVSRSPTKKDWDMISSANEQADILIVSPHWGQEYKPASKLQKEWARLIVENGAELVVGHHPHVVQEHETINNSLVFYSLGNLVFDQMWSEETKSGILVEVAFRGKTLENYRVINTYMENWAQPQMVSSEKLTSSSLTDIMN